MSYLTEFIPRSAALQATRSIFKRVFLLSIFEYLYSFKDGIIIRRRVTPQN